MNRFLSLFTIFLLAVFAGVASPALAHPAPDGFAALTERMSPSVVSIATSKKLDADMPRFPKGSAIERYNDLFDPDNRMENSMGSGFVVDAKGVIVTNNHVIEDADEVQVTFADGTVLEAKIAGRDPATDLAVLRVNPAAPLEAITFGDSDEAKTGDWVIAIGNPFGLGRSVSAGIISAMDRDISSGRYDQFIQTDAAINRGNSGGPLFNMQGEVIGVNSAILSPSGGSVGIGFSIPSNMVVEIVDGLLENGKIERGWIGAHVQSISLTVAKSFGLETAKGAIVYSVTEGGPAEAAGLQPGDLILSFDDKPVQNDRVLTGLSARAKPEQVVELGILRDDKPKTLLLKLGLLKSETAEASEEDSSQEEAIWIMNMQLADLDAKARRAYSIRSDVRGVVVLAIGDHAETSLKMREGDVIEQIAWQDVSSLDEFIAEVEKLAEKPNRPVLLLINRQGEQLRLSLGS